MGAAQRWRSHNSDAEHSSPIGCDAECKAVYFDCLTLKIGHYDLPKHQELHTQQQSASSSHETWLFAGGTHTNEQILNRQQLHHVADDQLSSLMVEEDINTTHIHIERLTQGAVHCTVRFTAWLWLAAVPAVPTRSTLDLLTMWWSWRHCKCHQGATYLSQWLFLHCL
jgi:hypothetical protein